MPTSAQDNVFVALGRPTRLRLLAALAKGPVAIHELAERSGISAKNVANHLIELRAAHLVASERKRFNKVIHAIAKPHKITADGSLDLGSAS